MQWIAENTTPSSNFLVLTGETEAMCESSAEWFPALTKRKSLSTLQGREWILGNKFGEFMGHQSSIQACIDEESDCMKRESVYFGEEHDYVYISIKSPTNNCKPVDTSRRTTHGLIIAMKDSAEYTIAYESDDAVIFEKVK
jgi:hypothetical protein